MCFVPPRKNLIASFHSYPQGSWTGMKGAQTHTQWLCFTSSRLCMESVMWKERSVGIPNTLIKQTPKAYWLEQEACSVKWDFTECKAAKQTAAACHTDCIRMEFPEWEKEMQHANFLKKIKIQIVITWLYSFTKCTRLCRNSYGLCGSGVIELHVE